MASSVQGREANMRTGRFHGQLGAAAARRAKAYHNSAEFARHVRAASGGAVLVGVFHCREPGPGVMAYANIGAFRQQPRPLDAVLVGPELPGGVVPVHDSSFYSYFAQQQPRPGAGRGMVFADLLPGDGSGAVYNGDYSALQPLPDAGHGEVLVDVHPDDAGHGEEFDGLLPSGNDAAYDNYGYYALQPRPGAGRGEVFIGPLHDGVGVVFVNSGNFAQQTLPGTGRADGINGMLRDPNLGTEHDGSGTLVHDPGAVYNDPGMACEHLRRLFVFVGMGACSVAVNDLAAGPGSPAVGFYLFMLLLAGLFLAIMHVLRV